MGAGFSGFGWGQQVEFSPLSLGCRGPYSGVFTGPISDQGGALALDVPRCSSPVCLPPSGPQILPGPGFFAIEPCHTPWSSSHANRVPFIQGLPEKAYLVLTPHETPGCLYSMVSLSPRSLPGSPHQEFPLHCPLKATPLVVSLGLIPHHLLFS